LLLLASRSRSLLWLLVPRLAGVFERFTERARQVVVLAQEEARILKNNYIDTEHILSACSARRRESPRMCSADLD
jgi:hypothetical protein